MKKFLISAAMALGIMSSAQAQWAPSKGEPVRAVIPFAPGGGTDGAFRHFQKYLEGRGINIVPVYKPGAEGVVGHEEAAKAATDGQTIMFGTIATMAQHRVSNPNYRFQVISNLRSSVMTLVTHPGSGINSIEDLEKELRKDKTTKTFGAGAPGQKLALEQLFLHSRAVAKPNIAGYKGGGPVVQDLLGGHVDIAMLPMSILDQHIKAGKLRVLGITADYFWKEIEVFPNLYKRYPNWTADDGFVISLPAGVKPEVFAFWNDVVKAYLADPKTRDDFHKEFTTVDPFGPKFSSDMLERAFKKAQAAKK